MRTHRLLVAVVVGLAAIAPACGPGPTPDIVAIEYLRAANTGEADRAMDLVDIEGLVERVSDEVMFVQSEQRGESFMRDTVRTIVWGLFQQGRRADYAYDASDVERSGDRAVVTVLLTDAEGSTTERDVHLRQTGAGWRISGESLDPLVAYAVQRLQEQF